MMCSFLLHDVENVRDGTWQTKLTAGLSKRFGLEKYRKTRTQKKHEKNPKETQKSTQVQTSPDKSTQVHTNRRFTPAPRQQQP